MSESSTPNPDVWASPLRITAAAYLALHLMPLATGRGVLWGVDALVYLPGWAAALFVTLSVGVLWPGLAVLLLRACPRVDPWSTWQRTLAAAGAMALVLLAASIVLEPATPLLGDGLLWLTEVSAEFWSITETNRAPLVAWLARTLHTDCGLSPQAAYQTLSRSAGTLFVFATFWAARTIAMGSTERWAIAAALLTAGYMPQFLGYVENYPLFFPLQLVFLVTATQTARGASPLVPALVVGLMVVVHPISVVLMPVLVLVVAMRTPQSPGARIVGTAGTLAAACAAGLATLAALGISPGRFLAGFRRDTSLPILGEPGFREAYRLVSGLHAADIGNALLLSAPLFVLALPAILGSKRFASPGLRSALWICGLSGALELCVLSVSNPAIGAFRDWDVLALPAVPLTLWACLYLFGGRSGARQVLVPAALAALLHTLPWAAVNASARATEARYGTLLDLAPASTHGRAYGWDTLGTYYFHADRLAEARSAWETAIAVDPENPRSYVNAGSVAVRLGDPSGALRLLRKAVDIRRDDAKAYYIAGLANMMMGRKSRAIAALETALQLAPHMQEIREVLGQARAMEERQAPQDAGTW